MIDFPTNFTAARCGLALVALAVAVTSPTIAAETISCDVGIYGGTSGGVVAAVQAARMGKSAVIIEPGKHLGGMTSGGLSAVDIGDPRTVGGIAREYFTRLALRYGKKLPWGEKHAAEGAHGTGGAFAIEPHAAEALFEELLREAGGKVRVLRGARLATVKKEGNRLDEAVLEGGRVVRAAMWIDASYEGDLLAASGVETVVGREANSKYNETLNGWRISLPPLTKFGPIGANGRQKDGRGAWMRTIALDPFVVPGDRDSGLLPLVSPLKMGTAGEAAPGVQAYCYRLCLTDDPDNRLPIAPPPDYDAARYELQARYIAACLKAGDPIDMRWFCMPLPLPNRKFDFNTAWLGANSPGLGWGWAEASYDEREKIAQAHENHQRGLLHFLTTDARVPRNIRDEFARFGLPKDEFPDQGGWPHQLYIREARRMVSDYVMTEHHAYGRQVAPRPVALASYGVDAHEAQRIEHGGIVVDEGKLMGHKGIPGPYPIGYDALVPRAAECANLFATFCISASHVCFASTRMEPVLMMNSQAAATAAALAIDRGTSVQEVEYAQLRKRLIADKQVLPVAPASRQSSTHSSTPADRTAADSWMPRPRKLAGVVVDDAEATLTGEWERSSRQQPLVGDAYRHDLGQDRGAKSARFSVKLPTAGEYEVRLLYTPHANRATNVPVVVRAADGQQRLQVNQQADPLRDGIPQALGAFSFTADSPAEVTVLNEGCDGIVVVDGVQLVAVAAAQAERVAVAAERRALQGPIQLAQPMAAGDVAGKRFDVIVVGGTPGGVACAVRSAREGCAVLLVQHNGHIGGMLTNGLTQWDALYGGHRAPLFSELLDNIDHYYATLYGDNSHERRVTRFTQSHYPLGMVEPHVAEREFNRLVAGEKNIALLLHHYPVAVERDGRLVQSVTLRESGGQAELRIAASMFVDATYEGDLAALAKVPYRVGREARDEYGEPHAGKIFTNMVDAPAPRDAVEGRLNIRPYRSKQGAIDPDSPRTADGAVQAYNMRFSVTWEPSNRVAVAKPANYNREEYLTFDRRYIGAFNGPRGKSMMNSPILPGENHAYPEADWPTRQRLTQRHRDFGLGLIYFLQHDESIPAAQREKFRAWGLPKDEFADNGHVPYEMYVREARRIVGRHVFTEHDNSLAPDLARTPVHADSVAITDWYMDSHACTLDSRPKYHYDGKLILTEESRPAQIPYRSLLPQGVDNLLVPVCLSATHVAWGAVRLEPVWLQTGEAAGFALGLAKELATTPAELPADKLVRRLVEQRMMISFFNDVDVADGRKATAAVQYFGARGCFRSYDARPTAPLTVDVAGVWLQTFAQLAAGEAVDPTATARALPVDEWQGKTQTLAQFARAAREALTRKKVAAAPFDAALAEHDERDGAPLSRGVACELLYAALAPPHRRPAEEGSTTVPPRSIEK